MPVTPRAEMPSTRATSNAATCVANGVSRMLTTAVPRIML
jgi:hypothetical protein